MAVETPLPPCRRCSECTGEEHHFCTEIVDEFADGTFFTCKHCECRVAYDDESLDGFPDGAYVVLPPATPLEDDEDDPRDTPPAPAEVQAWLAGADLPGHERRRSSASRNSGATRTNPGTPPKRMPTRKTTNMGNPCLLFLDIDGVLNSGRFFFGTGFAVNNWDEMVDPAAVARLNEILRRTSARVVISSSWRFTKTLPEIREILGTAGFVGEIIGATPLDTLDRGPDRGHEIEEWLAGYAAPGAATPTIVILDDCGIGPLTDRLVRTTFADGLLDEHVERAVALLCERCAARLDGRGSPWEVNNPAPTRGPTAICACFKAHAARPEDWDHSQWCLDGLSMCAENDRGLRCHTAPDSILAPTDPRRGWWYHHHR